MAKIILSTKRLILRTWEPSDVPLMTAISSDPKVMEHFPALQDNAATQTLIDHINQHYEKFGYAAYAVEIKDSTLAIFNFFTPEIRSPRGGATTALNH
jgi:RimJ/RimL family protein N-acetyltransferase